MMHFPWDKNFHLLANETNFDQRPIQTMRQYAPDFEVRLWIYSRIRDLCQTHYPSVWNVLQGCPHPVMLVDVLRWVVIHHFGGIYWQMNATPLRPMESHLPSASKRVRLFTEFCLSPEQCRAMAAEPIRNGEPEEPTRVLIQAFSALPNAPFVKRTLDFLLERVRNHVPKSDYDILYITGNAAVSTAYSQFGKEDATVELVGLAESRRMIKLHYCGSWRRETPSRSTPPFSGSDTAPRLDRLPMLGAAFYRWLRLHPHETMLANLDAEQPRTSCFPHLVPLIERMGIRSVFEAPCGLVSSIPSGISYVGGDPNRAIVAANREIAPPGIRFRHVNLLYSRFPQVDLFICPDFLEWLPFAEIHRILHCIARSKPKYLALTGSPLQMRSWDTALGDYRPLNPCLPPLHFPEPLESIDLCPLPRLRPDRRLMIWPIHAGFIQPICSDE